MQWNFKKLISKHKSICESQFFSPPSLRLSIELPVCCFPCPCCSLDCSVAWNRCWLIPCLERWLLDFHCTSFLANQEPILILSLKMLQQERGGKQKENMTEILVDEVVCFNIRSSCFLLSLTVGKLLLRLFVTTRTLWTIPSALGDRLKTTINLWGCARKIRSNKDKWRTRITIPEVLW